MVCRAGENYKGEDEPNKFWRNWNGDVLFKPENLRHPATLESLVEVIAIATDLGQELHVVGSGWSFEDCAKSDGVMVRIDQLNRALHYVVGEWGKDVGANTGTALRDEWRQTRNDHHQLVHFEAGIRVADFTEQLAAVGLAMPTLGGSNGQSLAGAFSTSSHGGDWQQPPFPDVVRAVHLVTVSGQELWIERESNPITLQSNEDTELLKALPCQDTNIIRNDRIFDAVLVACGRFGIIYSMVIEVRRLFRVVQVVTSPPGSSVLQALRRGQGTRSVFTPLFRLLNNDPIPAGMEDAAGVPYFLQIVFNSQRPNDTWVTRRWETNDFTKPDVIDPPQGSKQELAITIVAVANATLGLLAGTAGAIGGAVGGIIGSILAGPFGGLIGSAAGASLAVTITDLVTELDAMVATGNALFGSVVAAALNALWKIPGAAYAIPHINYMVIDNDFSKKKIEGRRGPHYLISTGSRADSDQDDFRVDSIELVFDATKAGYLDFLDEVMALAPLFPQAGIISLRPSLTSSALISMHNVPGGRAVSIEIASLKNLPGNAMWMAFVHEAAIRHNGRPHWGQYNKLDAITVAALYNESLNDWREALSSVVGNSTLFSNAFTRQRGLEPQGMVREVTSVKKYRGTITHLCNDGQLWSPVSVSQAIEEIREGTARYITRHNKSMALIKVVKDGKGGFYLRSQSDKTSADNLDNLPLSERP